MDGIGECGCSGVVGNHFQIGIAPYFGFTVAEWYDYQANQCEIPRYLRKDIVITEERKYRPYDGTYVTTETKERTFNHTMNKWTGRVEEGWEGWPIGFGAEPTPPAGVDWLIQNKVVSLADQTHLNYVFTKGFYQNSYTENGVFYLGAYYLRTVTVEEVLSIPNDIAAWKLRCEDLIWRLSIDDIRERITEDPEYSGTLHYHESGGAIRRMDFYGVAHVWDTGTFDASGLRFVWDLETHEPVEWMSAGMAEVVRWFWDIALPIWNVQRGLFNSGLREVDNWTLLLGMNWPMKNRFNNWASFYYNPDDYCAGWANGTPPASPCTSDWWNGFETSIRLFTLPDTVIPPGSPEQQRHYRFTQRILTGTCEETEAVTSNTFYLSTDTEMILDMNEDTDGDRIARGTQSVALEADE